MRLDSIVLVLFEREFAPLTTGGREFRGLPGEGVIVYQTDDNLQETLLMGGDNAVEGFTAGVLQSIEGGKTVHVTMDSRSIVPDVVEMSATSAASLIHNKGIVPNFTTPPGPQSWVFRQSPRAGHLVAKGSTVIMVPHAGPLP